MSKAGKKKKKLLTFLSLIVLFLIGFGIYMYPYFADLWNAHRNSLLISDYQASVASEDESSYDAELESADAYNRKLAGMSENVVTDLKNMKDPEYEALLDYNDSGVMGYIEIPKLDLTMSVYHYSTDEVLDKGIGHVHGSSLPVGGDGSHCVLSGHRGLPESKMFTDLDEMELGDRFYLHVLTRDMAYEVSDIRVVLPYEVSNLTVQPGEDLVTLVTCTPYSVNTHRLLVTGKRVSYDLDTKASEEAGGKVLMAKNKVTPVNMLVLGFTVFMVIITVYVIASGFGEKKKDHFV